MWICRFSKTTVPGMFRPPTRILDRGYADPIRCAMAPTRYSCVNSPSSASWIETLGAPNRRALVSAICCNDRPASPGVLAMARRISALAVWRSRAVRSWLFSFAVSDLGLPASRLPDFGLGRLEQIWGASRFGLAGWSGAFGRTRAFFSCFSPARGHFSHPRRNLSQSGRGRTGIVASAEADRTPARR